jgi:uncharacterized membrane protein YsdA (DUF1294 family)
MIDPRNRPALYGSLIAGVAAFVVLWLIGLPPLVAWMVGWSVPAFAMYGIDKRQAQAGGWRVPEIVLHGLALVGGVVGAWAGRAVFHHKTQHVVFTIVLVAASVLWAVVVAWAILG